MAFKIFINNWDNMDSFGIIFGKTESLRKPRSYLCIIGKKSKQFSSVEGCYNYWCNNGYKPMLILVNGYIPKKTIKEWYGYISSCKRTVKKSKV